MGVRLGKEKTMVEVMAFMLGFGGVVSVWEVVKTSKKGSKGSAIRREAEKLGRYDRKNRRKRK